MAIKALVLSQTLTYVSDKDPCKRETFVPVDPENPKAGTKKTIVIDEGATEFILRPLDVFLMGHIYDTASILTGKQGGDELDIKTRVNTTNIEAVRFGLAGFNNFQDAVGNHIKFRTNKAFVNGREYTAVEDSILRMFGVQLVAELATEIKKLSEVTKDEEGNSEEGSRQSGSYPNELVLTANGSENGDASQSAA